MSLPDPHAAATRLLDALIAAPAADALGLLTVALSAAQADGLAEAACYVRPTSTEHVTLPRPIVQDRVALERQLAGAAVRVRAGRLPWGR